MDKFALLNSRPKASGFTPAKVVLVQAPKTNSVEVARQHHAQVVLTNQRLDCPATRQWRAEAA